MHIATKGSKIDISSKNKLEEFAKNFGEELKKGDTFFLFGEIGVGKTTFVKYLINYLELKFNQEISEVTSPTFNIMHEYKAGDLFIKHYDLFRLKSVNELQELNLFDKNDKSIIFIEWPQIIKEKSKLAVNLYFEYANEYKDRFINFR